MNKIKTLKDLNKPVLATTTAGTSTTTDLSSGTNTIQQSVLKLRAPSESETNIDSDLIKTTFEDYCEAAKKFNKEILKEEYAVRFFISLIILLIIPIIIYSEL